MIKCDFLAQEIKNVLFYIENLQGTSDPVYLKRIAKCRKHLQLLIRGDYYGFWKSKRKDKYAHSQTIYRYQKYKKKSNDRDWFRGIKLSSIQKIPKVKRRGVS